MFNYDPINHRTYLEVLIMAFFALEKLNQLHDGYQKKFSINGLSLLLLQSEGRLYLIENRCPHMDVPLTEAKQLPGAKLQCRAHGIEFDLDSGKACGPLAGTLDCLKAYTLAYEGTSVGIDV